MFDQAIDFRDESDAPAFTKLMERLGDPKKRLLWAGPSLAPIVLGLTLLGAGGVGVPEPGAFVQKHLQDSVSDVSILEVEGRGIFVYGRTTTNDPALLASFCSGAIEALEMILPGRSAHVLWHTPSSIDYKCPIPTTRRKLPPREPEPSE